jgi:hypothetical protein
MVAGDIVVILVLKPALLAAAAAVLAGVVVQVAAMGAGAYARPLFGSM